MAMLGKAIYGFNAIPIKISTTLFKYEESEKVGLKLNVQKTKIMASDPITP